MQNIITIDEIFKRNEISVRTYHVCKYNKLHSILDILNYYYQNKSFEKLRNCGSKSNLELVKTCTKYKNDYIENREIEIKKENALKEIVLNLTRVQREVINSFIFVKTNSLSVRSKNAIAMYLKNNLKVKNYTEKILLSESFNVNDIKNVGAKCVPELEVNISIIKDFIFEVSQTTDEKYLIALKNKYLIQQTFGIPFVPSEILESESIFLLTDFLFNQNAFFDETKTIVVKKGLKLYNHQKELTLDEIAEQVDLSRERVRQIRKNCLEDLFSNLLFISNFNDDLFQKYNIDTESSYIEINTDILEKINNLNHTHFSREFIIYILSAYLHNRFTLIGDYEDILQFKYFNSRNKHNWNNFYLIDKKLASEIDFTFFMDDISSRLSARIEESYSFNFKSYLSKFLTNNNIKMLDLLSPICERVINDEFEIYLDLDENLDFKRNSSRQVHEYAYEALQQLGKPSKVKEIFEKVIELHPNYNTEEAKIRVSMKRIHGFVPVGRKSVFGLKKWENELENFKGGTIRDIVEEYLMQFSTPKHISNITEYVLKYRPKSSQYSILQNLKLDESGLYIFYKDSHIGLASKKYESDFKKLSEVTRTDIKTWEETFEILQNFISIKQRLPFSNGVPEEEIKLYRWINLQQSKQKKGNLEENKMEKLNSLLTKHPITNGRRRLNSQEKYEELIVFISTNHRLPSANKDGEENLYQFYYKQRKLFEANELDNLEEIKFIEVAKLFQKIKI
ncbi:sigma factor-like helix-turn-helix DNA-binding protein [Flavobacterium sp. FlaQc-30]|uniref:helicase associated domain-containing protein n=1 Tax=Flavobacterium sp. FlaQc-30 TaxID=3374179 RepID=UPI003757E094